MSTIRLRSPHFVPWMVIFVQCLIIGLFISHTAMFTPSFQTLSQTNAKVTSEEQSLRCHEVYKFCLEDLSHDEEMPEGSREVRDHVITQIRSGVPVTFDGRPGPARVFYNRVPKCGSSTLMDLIIEMSKVNNFTFARAREYMRFWLEDKWQENFVNRVKSIPTPAIFERHLHFLNFRRYNMEQPSLINMVREPLDRLVSWYYFRRYQSGHIRDMPTVQRIRTYDECVLGNHSECVQPMGDHPEEGYFKIIPFFCGQESFCREPTEKALLAAVHNVKKYYTLVGTLQQYPRFVEALEHLLPTYFHGATQVFQVFGILGGILRASECY